MESKTKELAQKMISDAMQFDLAEGAAAAYTLEEGA